MNVSHLIAEQGQHLGEREKFIIIIDKIKTK
jgi:hypothetical protein